MENENYSHLFSKIIRLKSKALFGTGNDLEALNEIKKAVKLDPSKENLETLSYFEKETKEYEKSMKKSYQSIFQEKMKSDQKYTIESHFLVLHSPSVGQIFSKKLMEKLQSLNLVKFDNYFEMFNYTNSYLEYHKFWFESKKIFQLNDEEMGKIFLDLIKESIEEMNNIERNFN